MRVIWSFWSTPYRRHYHCFWRSERAHLLSWILSVAEASKHYTETCLFTDDAGAEMLVGGLGLPFRSVETSLQALNDASVDDGWWVLGKLSTYAAQSTPFVHLDNDVFLWQPLPSRLMNAQVLAQNPERFEFDDQSLYRLGAFMSGITASGGWLPEEWLRYAERRMNMAFCCGIVGGHDVGFLHRYASLAMKIVRHPRNQAVWPTLGVRDNILVEQYFLAACMHHEESDPTARPPRVGAEFLFPSSTDAFDPGQAEQAGYTHLIGDAKRDRSIVERLERRVRAAHPELYDRCLAYLGRARRG